MCSCLFMKSTCEFLASYICENIFHIIVQNQMKGYHCELGMLLILIDLSPAATNTKDEISKL